MQSDHLHVVVFAKPRYQSDAEKENIYKTIDVRQRNAVEQAKQLMKDTNWDRLLPGSTGIEENVATFTKYFQEILSDPSISKKKRVKVNGNKKWFTGRCKLINKRRDRAYRLGDLESANEFGLMLAEECKAAKQQYYQKQLSKAAENPGSAFKVMKDFLGQTNSTSATVYRDCVPDLLGKSDEECANVLNQFYNRFSKGVDDISTFALDFENCPRDLPPRINTWQVKKAMGKIDAKKATGPDGIPGWLLKDCCEELAYPVTILFNASLTASTVPSLWKTGEIIPVPKKAACSILKDLRPITKTSLLSKLLEKFVCEEIEKAREGYGDPLQFGFTKGRSTVDALITATDFIQRNLDKDSKASVFGLLIDFSSAYDSVSHKALVDILIRDRSSLWLTKWIISWLSEGSHRVVFGEASSTPPRLTAGLRQGSPPSSLLFNIDTDDIAINESEKILPKFADDSKVLQVISSSDDHDSYQQTAKEIQQAAAARSLQLNAAKCKEIIFNFSEHSAAQELPQ